MPHWVAGPWARVQCWDTVDACHALVGRRNAPGMPQARMLAAQRWDMGDARPLVGRRHSPGGSCLQPSIANNGLQARTCWATGMRACSQVSEMIDSGRAPLCLFSLNLNSS